MLMQTQLWPLDAVPDVARNSLNTNAFYVTDMGKEELQEGVGHRVRHEKGSSTCRQWSDHQHRVTCNCPSMHATDATPNRSKQNNIMASSRKRKSTARSGSNSHCV